MGDSVFQNPRWMTLVFHCLILLSPAAQTTRVMVPLWPLILSVLAFWQLVWALGDLSYRKNVTAVIAIDAYSLPSWAL
jgi:hypothetical protein